MLNGNRLKTLRKERGYTQTELGELIGVGKSTICCYEKELRNPTIDVIIELIQVFGVSSDYLIGADYFAKTVDKTGNTLFAFLTKEEITFIEELKKNKYVYDILLEDPKRGVELIKKEID